MVGEELQRDAGDDRHEHGDGVRDLDDVVGNLVERVAVLGGDRDDATAAGLDFAHVADDLVEQGVLRGDDDYGHVPQLKFARNSTGMERYRNNCMLDSRRTNICETTMPKLMTDARNTMENTTMGKISPRRGKSKML